MNASEQSPGGSADRRSNDHRFLIGLARALGGAMFFSLPMMMTMEMWWLGFSIPPLRLALFTAVLLPVLVLLAHYAGFENVFKWKEQALDALAAYAVGWLAAAGVLTLLAVLHGDMPAGEIISILALQAVPGSVGALLAQSQLGGERDKRQQDERRDYAGYGGELFIMAVGAIFLAFNLAPTEEIVLLAYRMSLWHTLALALVSILAMHALVYVVEFHGQSRPQAGVGLTREFFRFTVAGYALVLLINLYVLWTFGRVEGASLAEAVKTMVVLGLPGALGAAAARLIL